MFNYYLDRYQGVNAGDVGKFVTGALRLTVPRSLNHTQLDKKLEGRQKRSRQMRYAKNITPVAIYGNPGPGSHTVCKGFASGICSSSALPADTKRQIATLACALPRTLGRVQRGVGLETQLFDGSSVFGEASIANAGADADRRVTD
jgi:hypothetical protein